MSFTSKYTFFQGPFNGIFVGTNTPQNSDLPFSAPSFSGNQYTVTRPNGEQLIDLGPEIATPATTLLVLQMLHSAQATLLGGLRVRGAPWPSVPYFSQQPQAHKVDEILVCVDFDFQVPTPWFCSDAVGTISIYLFLFLDSKKHLKGRVDGNWFHFDGGGPLCSSPISQGLNKALGGVAGLVNPILDKALLNAAANIMFEHLYLLPGNGTHSPAVVTQNASNDVALGLLLA